MPDQHELPEDVQRFLQVRRAAVQQLIQQMQGAIALYCEMHGLEGQWQPNEAGTALMRIDRPPQEGKPET